MATRPGGDDFDGRRESQDEGEDAIAAGTPLRLRAAARAGRRVGQWVRHADFGDGVVVAAAEAGDDVKYTVRFGTRVLKVLGSFLTAGDGHGS